MKARFAWFICAIAAAIFLLLEHVRRVADYAELEPAAEECGTASTPG